MFMRIFMMLVLNDKECKASENVLIVNITVGIASLREKIKTQENYVKFCCKKMRTRNFYGNKGSGAPSNNL